jgi:hypothetical protein
MRFTIRSVHEVLEQQLQVVRTGAGLGVPLKAEGRPVRARDSLERAVEQRAMRGAQIGRQVDSSTAKPWFWLEIRTRPESSSEDRMIGAVVPELHFDGFRAARETQGVDVPDRCRTPGCRSRGIALWQQWRSRRAQDRPAHYLRKYHQDSLQVLDLPAFEQAPPSSGNRARRECAEYFA